MGYIHLSASGLDEAKPVLCTAYIMHMMLYTGYYAFDLYLAFKKDLEQPCSAQDNMKPHSVALASSTSQFSKQRGPSRQV